MTKTPDIREAWVPGTWALVLAAGDGNRLKALTTTPNGVIVPKQICSLQRGPSLLSQALQRAGAVAPTIQTCAVVADQHRWWWELPLGILPKENIFVQPMNRGTAHSLLLALLRVHARDPKANVAVMPADHYIRQEVSFAHSIRRLAELASHNADVVYLLGIDPDRPEPDLGYIVPADHHTDRPSPVQSFVERPDAVRVRGLLKAGALWNTFIIAGSVHALLALYTRDYLPSVMQLRSAMPDRKRPTIGSSALAPVFQALPTVDFSRDLLAPQVQHLQVLHAPDCGWNDLGTVPRVIDVLRHLPPESRHVEAATLPSATLCLAEQCGKIGRDKLLSFTL
jgi:mannose-1-phosphate guanylyltransferase